MDLGLEFSNGRFQKYFLEVARKIRKNQDSPYYEAIKDVVSNVGWNRLSEFGMNLGYNGCTKETKIIRRLEKERHYNIPWFLNLPVNNEVMAEKPEFYQELLRQEKDQITGEFLDKISGLYYLMISVADEGDDNDLWGYDGIRTEEEYIIFQILTGLICIREKSVKFKVIPLYFA
ncbi:MAG TPA: hypothetical protein H9740_09275 [Candidatus Hungatella pullicola]|nr:hypothetical protein [Candidatus Hungatella pullicola]